MFPDHICYRQLGQDIGYITWDPQVLYWGPVTIQVQSILLWPLQIEELQKYSCRTVYCTSDPHPSSADDILGHSYLSIPPKPRFQGIINIILI